MTYTLTQVARDNDLDVQKLRVAWDWLLAMGWVRIVGMDETGEWLYEPHPRLMGKAGRN